jgi:hypothetical protein
MRAFLQTQHEFADQLPGAIIAIIRAGHELPSLTPEKVSAAIFEVVKKARLASR